MAAIMLAKGQDDHYIVLPDDHYIVLPQSCVQEALISLDYFHSKG